MSISQDSADSSAHLPTPTRIEILVPTRAAMLALGNMLAALLRPGDLVILSGELGAGKTTFTQGIGAGLGVRGPVTSPTFVIARVHPSLGSGPQLVHVDAYRLASLAELDDLDLDTALTHSVTVVEWGSGLAEELAADRLEVQIQRRVGGQTGPDGDRRRGSGETAADTDDEDEERTVTITAIGDRWNTLAADFDRAEEEC